MGITRLNHAVLYVRDIERSVAFYIDVLGFRRIDMTPEGFAGAAFLQAPGSTNDHDLGLFEIGADAGPSVAGLTTVGLYHLAWEIDTLAELKQLATSLADHGALAGSSDHGTTKSLYGKDPDGQMIDKHRKLMPTGSERTMWGMGDGSMLNLVPTELGRIGGPICWESYMPLARSTSTRRACRYGWHRPACAGIGQ